MKKVPQATFLPLVFPTINPVAIKLGPIQVHWYGLAYISGILLGNELAKKIIKKVNLSINLNDLLTTIMIGIILGGRLGYVLFYDPIYYLNNPFEIIAIWNGGMSFHGGALGAFFATIYECKKQNIELHKGLDLLAICATPGLFFGRIANFINAELYGRVTNHSFGMVFPNAGPLPRHPSQLYEAGLEGIALFIILFLATNYAYKEGRIFSLFVIGYGIIRFFIEFTREPDGHLGLLALHLSMGQWLSILMIILGSAWTYGRIKNILR